MSLCSICKSEKNQVVKFSCNHQCCFECIKNSLTLTQVLKYKSSSTISIDCLENKQNCKENGYYVLSISSLLEYLSMNSSNNLNYNENNHIYSSKLKNKNRDIERTITNLSKQYKDMINNDIETEIREQSYSVFDCLAKEIKNIKSNTTVETMISSLNNINNESLFSCDVEKVNTSNIEGVFYGHTNTIWTLIELNETTIASGSYDNSICIWNMNNHEAIQTLNKHKSKVTSLLKLLPPNNVENSELIFASGSADTTLIIWGCPSNVSSQYTPLTTLYGHTSTVNSMIQFGSDKLISGAHEIIVWDMNKNYNIISILSTYKFPVTSLCNSSLGDGFFSGSFENIYIWSPKLKCVSMIKTNGHYITCLCYLNDRNLLLSGAYDKTIRVWDRKNNNKNIRVLKEHTNTVWEIFQINKVKMCSGSSNEIIIWDMNMFVSLVVIEEDNYALIRLSNGRFAYGCFDNKIKVLNTDEFV